MNRAASLDPRDATGVGAFTADDYCRMLDAGAFTDMRVELVDGDLVKMMPAYLSHGEANLMIGAKLVAAIGGRERAATDLLIAIDANTLRAADIAIVAQEARRDAPVSGSDVRLAVEIADTTLARDLDEKLADYARAGIGNYWVVDLQARVVHVMAVPAGQSYRETTIVRFGEPLAVPGTDAWIAID